MTEEQIAKRFQEGKTAYEQHDFETAAAIFEELVQEEQHPFSAAYLAEMHYLGLAVPCQREKIYEYLQIANEDHDARTQDNTIFLYINLLRTGIPNIVSQDVQTADEVSIHGAENMYPFALSQCHWFGLGQFKHDQKMAAKWLKSEADQGDLLKKYQYANLLLKIDGNTAEAELILRELVELGSSSAAVKLAEHLLDKDEPEIVDDCITLLNYAEMHNNAAACLTFSTYHQKYTGNMERSREYLEKAIELNEPAAKTFLALQLLNNVDEEDEDGPQQGMELLREAAIDGDCVAQLYLGRICREEEPELAVEMFKKAAKQHHPSGMLELARAYLDGLGPLEQDPAAAFQLFNMAAAHGNMEAQGLLGVCYLNGLGVTEDIIAAMAHLRIAAEHDDWNAMTLLGKIYADPATPYCNHSLALECYRRSAAAGDPEAMYQLAKCHLEGTMTARNVKEGLKLLQQAADETGHTDSVYELGCAYLQGKYGLKHDEEKAMQYLQQAAQERHDKACLELGVFLKDTDLDISRELLIEAASAGLKEAIYQLACLEEENGNLIYAFKFYEDASELHYPSAMRALAKFHQEGNLVPEDQERAEKLLRDADRLEQMLQD